MVTELWRDVIGYEGYYQVSNKGRVRSVDRVVQVKAGRGKYDRSLKGKVMPLNGIGEERAYRAVVLCRDGRIKTHYVHRLVAFAFILEESGKPEVNHKNGVKHDNRARNLEWISGLENKRHAIKAGRCKHMTPGNAPGTKLTAEKAKEIRRRIAAGEMQSKIADDFMVCRQTITFIKQGVVWKE